MSERLHVLQQRLDVIAQAEGGAMFKGKPDRWYDDARWRCENDHVSRHYIKSEVDGAVCPACRQPVLLTFPEDDDGRPLPDAPKEKL